MSSTYVLSIVAEGKDNASGPLSAVASALSSIGQIAGGILTAGLIQNVAQGIWNFGKSSIEATAQMQAFNMGLSTLVARELRATDKTLDLNTALNKAAPIAGNLADQLRKIAITSPYELGTVQETFRLGMAFGFTSKEATYLTKGILNMASGVGATNEMLSRMSYNFAQIRLQGKVTGVDIRQLALAGFDLVGALRGIGDAYGLEIKNHEDFNKAIASGKLTWQQFAEGFEKYADENFGGAAERMSRTLMGLGSTFKDLFVLTMPKILGPAAERVTGFFNNILNDFIAFSDSGALEELGTRIGDRVGVAVDYLQNLYDALKDAGPASSEFREALLSMFSQDVQEQLFSMFDYVQNIASGFIDPLLALSEKLGWSLAGAFEKIQTGLQNFADFFVTNGPGIIANVQSIFGTMLTAMGDLGGTVIPWVAEQFNKISEWFVANGPLIQQYMASIGEVFSAFGQIVVALWSVIQPLLTGLLDLLLQFATYWMQIFTGDIQGAFQTLLAILVTTFNTIYNVVVAFLNMIAGFMGTSLAQIGQVWGNNWRMFLSILQQIGAIIVTTVSTFVTNIYDSFISGMQQIVSYLQGLVGTMRNMGKQLMQGLYDGISSMIGAVVGLAKKVAEEIAKAFATTAKIKSPSQVFFGFGKNIVQGLANGIKATSSAVKAIEGTSAGVSSAFSQSVSPASGGMSPVTINVDGTKDPEAVAREIYKILKQQGAVA